MPRHLRWRAAPVLALFLFVVSLASADVFVVQLQHVRPSRMLAVISGDTRPGARVYQFPPAAPAAEGSNLGLIVQGITALTADDLAGTIAITGSQEAADEMKKVLAEFDVARRQVTVRITIKSQADKYESTCATQISNNAGWTLTDEMTGTSLQIRPRINGDGTVTGSFVIGNDAHKVNTVVRAKLKEPVKLRVADDGKVVFDSPYSIREVLPARTASSRAGMPEVEITITFDRVVLPGQGQADPSSSP
ncbi:MAG: hypothetical protein ACHQ50_07825 [Fimbriimonadales bacterium]